MNNFIYDKKLLDSYNDINDINIIINHDWKLELCV